IYGSKGHAEVTGLSGQTANQAVIVENEEDLRKADLSKPSVLFSQTTKSPEHFSKLAANLQSASTAKTEVHDTICRQVSNRGPHLMQFAAKHDIIVFAGGQKSSNARYLFAVCKEVNPDSHFISKVEELDKSWFEGKKSAGVCGATSTPGWLLEQIAEAIAQI
ncbi:MAG: 4-hydroxy-3-methylbut-2-enyl diphosphate reductase, partial [Mangrovibacterium sp.]